MNIFVVSTDPREAAAMLCDSHVVKMTLESAQLLCMVYPPGEAPYRNAGSHTRHPCTLWARASRANFTWLVDHGIALSDEYTFRYGKVHKSRAIIEWCRENSERLTFPAEELTPFAQAMPDEFRGPDPVAAYRAYYLGRKRSFAKWNRARGSPDWWSP